MVLPSIVRRRREIFYILLVLHLHCVTTKNIAHFNLVDYMAFFISLNAFMTSTGSFLPVAFNTSGSCGIPAC